MEAESQPQFHTANSMAGGVSGPSEPKRSAGAAGKKDKMQKLCPPPGRGGKLRGRIPLLREKQN